jgi:hypothetical protein
MKLDKLIQILDSLPDDEVLDTAEAMQRLGVNRRETIFTWAKTNPRLSFYSYLVPRGNGMAFWVFGNPRAIIATRKQFERGKIENTKSGSRKGSQRESGIKAITFQASNERSGASRRTPRYANSRP